jgi:hypothetical protein
LRTPFRVVAIIAVAVVVVGGAVAVAAALGDDGTRPPRVSLAGAVAGWLSADRPPGVTAELRLTTRLVDTGRLATGAALLAGATGTVHVAANGHALLDVRTPRGQTTIAFDGRSLTVYEAPSNTVYRLDAPAALTQASNAAGAHGTPDVASIGLALEALASEAQLTGPDPGVTAGQPSYTLRLSPRRDAGLLGALEVAWDAVRGVPLRVALYAEGRAEPVAELEATSVEYAPVPDADVTLHAPADARVVDLSSQLDELRAQAEANLGGRPTAEGVPAVSGAVPFALRAPDALVGLPRQSVRAIEWDGQTAALALYGRGLGQMAVFEQRANGPDGVAGIESLALPHVAIEGASGWELVTALGTVIHVERDGVRYTVAGSLPAVAAETVVRELLIR